MRSPLLVAQFDIFRLDVRPLWSHTAGSFEEAEKRIKILGAKTSGIYFIFDERAGRKVPIRIAAGESETLMKLASA